MLEVRVTVIFIYHLSICIKLACFYQLFHVLLYLFMITKIGRWPGGFDMSSNTVRLVIVLGSSKALLPVR